ncbi:hypothetical protein P280DRAFT_517001 [Massarina eburnea CBS 473.64]|uniref:Uncharacterized protein n=1 Tax=Massarina eburnea CBS 473.64 TaxID=1395130 RepID=A0A6A6S369_9PLEO|nr:hypothetical protein P280DRAFT_517001 [Massarina eburnea CBS 473.64]
MTSSSYTNADAHVSKLGQPFDPLGEYEDHDTIYTLSVSIPPRPPPRYLPSFLTRQPVSAVPHHIIRPTPLQSDPQTYDNFHPRDLSDMKTKTVKVKAHRFPLDMRCEHVYGGKETVCRGGCYVLERGEIARWFCKREDCGGHVFVGEVKKDDEGRACFGKKGERMVCMEVAYLGYPVRQPRPGQRFPAQTR